MDNYKQYLKAARTIDKAIKAHTALYTYEPNTKTQNKPEHSNNNQQTRANSAMTGLTAQHQEICSPLTHTQPQQAASPQYTGLKSGT